MALLRTKRHERDEPILDWARTIVVVRGHSGAARTSMSNFTCTNFSRLLGRSGLRGKTTLLNVLSGNGPASLRAASSLSRPGGRCNIDSSGAMPDADKPGGYCKRSDRDSCIRDPRQKARAWSAEGAGGNVGERLMAQGARHYGDIRSQALDWLEQVEIDAADRRLTICRERSPAGCCNACKSHALW